MSENQDDPPVPEAETMARVDYALGQALREAAAVEARLEAENVSLRAVVDAARIADDDHQTRVKPLVRGMRPEVAAKYLNTPLHLALAALDQRPREPAAQPEDSPS